MPVLSAPSTQSLLEIDGVTGVTLSGLEFSRRHDQSALRIRGRCDALTVRSCEFVGHDPGTEDPLALVHIAMASGTEQAPIRLIDSKILDARIGLVTGVRTTGADPTKHVVVQDCQLRCVPNGTGIPLIMIGAMKSIRIQNNIISMGQATVSLQFLEAGCAQSVQLENNTIHSGKVLLNFNRSVAEQDVRLIDNLFAGSIQTQPNIDKLETEFDSWLEDNGAISLSHINDSIQAALVSESYSLDVLESLEPNDAKYLQRCEDAPHDLPGARRTTASSQAL